MLTAYTVYISILYINVLMCLWEMSGCQVVSCTFCYIKFLCFWTEVWNLSTKYLSWTRLGCGFLARVSVPVLSGLQLDAELNFAGPISLLCRNQMAGISASCCAHVRFDAVKVGSAHLQSYSPAEQMRKMRKMRKGTEQIIAIASIIAVL